EVMSWSTPLTPIPSPPEACGEGRWPCSPPRFGEGPGERFFRFGVAVLAMLVVTGLMRADSPATRPPPGFVAATAPPSWIWCGPGAEKQTIYLRRTFEIQSAVSVARLVLAADDHATVFLDG